MFELLEKIKVYAVNKDGNPRAFKVYYRNVKSGHELEEAGSVSKNVKEQWRLVFPRFASLWRSIHDGMFKEALEIINEQTKYLSLYTSKGYLREIGSELNRLLKELKDELAKGITNYHKAERTLAKYKTYKNIVDYVRIVQEKQEKNNLSVRDGTEKYFMKAKSVLESVFGDPIDVKAMFENSNEEISKLASRGKMRVESAVKAYYIMLAWLGYLLGISSKEDKIVYRDYLSDLLRYEYSIKIAGLYLVEPVDMVLQRKI